MDEDRTGTPENRQENGARPAWDQQAPRDGLNEFQRSQMMQEPDSCSCAFLLFTAALPGFLYLFFRLIAFVHHSW